MDNQIEILRFVIKGCERESMAIFDNLLKELKLTANQVEVLTVLSKYGPLSVKDLGNLLICEKKSPSRLIRTLIKKNLLVKEQDQQDKRISLIALSTKGKKILPVVQAKDEAFNQLIAKHIPKQSEVKQLIQILTTYLKGTKSLEKIKRRFNLSKIKE